MKFSLALLAVAPAVISAKKSPKKVVGGNLPAVDIKANSKTGGRIMSKARRLEQEGGDDEAMTWVAGYSLKFHSCVATDDYYGGDFNDMNENAENYQQYQYEQQNENEDQNQNQNQNQNNANYQNGEYDAQAYQNGENANGYYYNQANNDRQNYQGLYVNQVAHFQLCPSSSCGKWNSKNCADYVVDLGVYVQAVLEAKMEAQQYNCEQVKENCWCENAQSEDQCIYSCYENAAQKKGFDYCIDMMYDNENEFDVVEALECKELEIDEEAVQAYYENQNYQQQMDQQQNGYNGYYNQEEEEQEMKLYAGPMCSPNGKAVYLATFSDETCSIKAVDGIYEALNFGVSIPYAKESLVDTGCISCKEPKEVDYQNYWDQQDPDEVTQSCSGLYELAGKCEEGLVGYFLYRNNAGCSYINELKNPSLLANVNANVPAKVFAGIFGVTTALLAAVSAVLWKKNSRQNVSLTADHPLA